MDISQLKIFEKNTVSFDFHGTLVERHYHHKHYNIEESTHLNFPVFQIFKKCLDLGIDTHIISFESINGVGDEGKINNQRILKKYGIDFPLEKIHCTDFRSKDAWFEDLNVEFHVDDDLAVILLAQQMYIENLLVDYKEHKIADYFDRISLNGKISKGKFRLDIL
jgi:hypothetical protein